MSIENNIIPHVQHPSAKVGVLDIGSNSIRLVVFENAGRVPLPIFNEKVLCGLGAEINITGRLSAKGCVSALANIERFIELVSRMNLAHFQIIATAAVRDAENARRAGRDQHVHGAVDEPVERGDDSDRGGHTVAAGGRGPLREGEGFCAQPLKS